VNTGTTNSNHVTVLYDPLCGWCYGATPAFRRLAAQRRVTLELLPTGLFAGDGARPVDHHFAAYAWTNDQRIQLLTGQPFSGRYRTLVLADRQTPLDSGPATMALTAAALTNPNRELDVLEAVQYARYVDGRNVIAVSTLASILEELDLGGAAARVQAPDPALLAAVGARTARAKRLLRELGKTGVPTVVVGEGVSRRAISNDVLYGSLEGLLRALEEV
jgi:putative protein-disulfide isomerase